VTGGTDAQADVSVLLKDQSVSALGHATHHDTMVASARAYVSALNKLAAKRERAASGIRASL
jgi:2-isopropylmalate synthase